MYYKAQQHPRSKLVNRTLQNQSLTLRGAVIATEAMNKDEEAKGERVQSPLHENGGNLGHALG